MNKQQIKLDLTNKSVEATFDTVTVDDLAAVTLLPANNARVGYSVSNTENMDVVIRYKEAATDDNIEGYILLSGETRVFHDSNYLGEISSIRLTTQGNQTSDILVTEW